MNKNYNFVSAVVYMRNNENVICDFIKALTTILNENFMHNEIIVVNDYSNKDSINKFKENMKTYQDNTITLINMSYFHGLEASMNAGVDLAIGDYVYEFDSAYIDYDEKLIIDVFNTCQQGYDIVSVSNSQNEKFSSKLFYKIFNRYFSANYSLQSESFRILSRRAINRIKSMNKTIPYRKALYVACGLKQENIKYNPIKLAYKGKENLRYRLNLAVNSLVIFTDFGYRVANFMVALMLGISVFSILYTIVIYLKGKPVEGWTTTILFLSTAFFGLFALLSVVIKYLQIIVDLEYRNTTYLYESVEKLNR